MYKGLYTSNEAITRFPKGEGIFFKKECVVKIQEAKILKIMLLIHLEYLKEFLFNAHNTLGNHKSARKLFDDLRQTYRGFNF